MSMVHLSLHVLLTLVSANFASATETQGLIDHSAGILHLQHVATRRTAGDKNIMVGSIRGAFQLGISANSAKLRATNRAGLFMTSLGLDHALHLTKEDWHGSKANAQAIIDVFRDTGCGMIEGNLDSYATPSVQRSHWNYTRDDDWPRWISELRWSPSIFLMNMNAKGSASTTQYTVDDISDVIIGTKDIKAKAGSINYVLPYLSPNSGIYRLWASDAYWSTARSLALTQGGLAIDIPVGYYLRRPSAYKQVVKDEIAWANRNHLIAVVLLSPCSTDSSDWTIIHSCSFSADPHFMTSAQEVVRQLHLANADPTIWAVGNYSEQSVSPYPGTDDANAPNYNPNTILAVAQWIAENAHTSAYPEPILETPGSQLKNPTIK